MDFNETAIREFYNDYQPPKCAIGTVRKLIRTVPEKYLQGLESVVLTNQSGLSRKRRLGKVTSRKRRHPRSSITGLYHPAYRGEKAWIELFVDKIEFSAYGCWWIPLLREMAFGMVLFHEIGHHIDYMMKPGIREKEDVADDWRKKLFMNFFRKKYWYLIPVRKPLVLLLKAFVRSL
jgi:hypothetical protein